MAEHAEGHPTVPVERDFVRKMEKFVRALSPEQQDTFSEILRHAAEPATFLSRQEFEAQKDAEEAKHGLTPDNIWGRLEYHWMYPPVGKIGADWSYPEESAAGWDYPEEARPTDERLLGGVGGGSWGYSDYVPVFWSLVVKHLLGGGSWDSIPWSELAAPSQLYYWPNTIPEEPTPNYYFASSYERFLRGAYEVANGQPGGRVLRDALMRALKISEVDLHEAWVDQHVMDKNLYGVSDDYTTFALTAEGAQWIESSPYYRFLRGAYEAANGQPGVRVHRDTVMHLSGLDQSSYARAWMEHTSEETVDGYSSSDDYATFVLTPKAIQKVESTTMAGP
jgi:hypothetical protein